MPLCSKKWNNASYKIADESETVLKKGKEELRIALNKMPVCRDLFTRFEAEKPLKGLKVAACLHVTKETANLCRVLKAGGAEIYLCGSNPLSTQDFVATALAEEGIHVYAWHNNTDEEFYECIHDCLKAEPNILIDDGADLIVTAHNDYPHYFEEDGCVIACQEETTTGVHRFKSMEKANALKTALFPVNDASCKNQFDNELGTGQGVIAAIRGMHMLFAGKVVVVAGFGHCSSGMALRSRGLGARVIITEVDPIKALKAVFAGYEVAPMHDIVNQADMIFTATGCNQVIAKEHIPKLKNGCVLANLGHFDVEIVAKDLYDAANGNRREIRENVEELILPNGNHVYLLAQGRLANLALTEGHPSEVMDMSFALQARMAEYIANNRKELKKLKKIIPVPEDINQDVALAKLESMGIKIDTWTDAQVAYINNFQEGT